MANDNDFDKGEEIEQERPSKSQRKRECDALQQLGEDLVKLADAKLASIPMPENLRDAILQAKAIKKHGGRKRQLQYIGKIMRDIEDVNSIQNDLHQVLKPARESAAQLHKLEDWRTRLVEEGDSALNEWLSKYPKTDRQHLRQLIRNVHKEKKQNKPPKAYREIYRFLKILMDGKD